MDKYIAVILLLHFTLIMFTFGQMNKPGKCTPWVGGAGNCVMNCDNDWSCTGIQKCCSVGCGRMCQIPCSDKCNNIHCAQDGECKVVDGCAQCQPISGKIEKLGKCFSFNAPSSNATQTCLNECENDFDCFGKMKCCAMGCKKMCQSVCSRGCDISCDQSSTCKIIDGCGQCVPSTTITTTTTTTITTTTTTTTTRTTTRLPLVVKTVPITKEIAAEISVTTQKVILAPGEKPGNCLKWQGTGPCLTNCKKDVDCPENRKCCTIGCGKICQEPCPTVCDWECFDGKLCKVVDGCAQCV